MSFIFSLFYDSIMDVSEKACLGNWRQELFQDLEGDILEIGAGTGANIAYFSNSITSMVLSEPDKGMRKLLTNKADKSVHNNIRISACSAENIDAEDESFDHVISALVCCSVSNINQTFSEIKRVLKPGGSLVFIEHVAAEEGTRRHRWQHRLNPFWKRLAGNCHLIRETESEITNAGFEIIHIKRESMRKALPFVRPTIRGLAVKP